MRKIIHVDMDQFFAAVEQLDHPELKGKPIAVGHDAERGVVSTASYEARRFGVHSAQSIQVAKRLCPQLVIVEPHFHRYKEVSAELHDIFHDYTDLIEPISLDEAFLDVTENKKGIELGVDIAREIKQRIKETTGLTASAGVSYCKFLAKIASDWRKPDGLTVIHPDKALDFIAQLKVEKIWGVGKRHQEGQLARLAIGQPERIPGEINLPLLTRNVYIVIRKVVRLTPRLDVLVELGVAVAVGVQLQVVVLVYQLHGGIPLGEPADDLRHQRIQLCLAWIGRRTGRPGL